MSSVLKLNPGAQKILPGSNHSIESILQYFVDWILVQLICIILIQLVFIVVYCIRFAVATCDYKLVLYQLDMADNPKFTVS